MKIIAKKPLLQAISCIKKKDFFDDLSLSDNAYFVKKLNLQLEDFYQKTNLKKAFIGRVKLLKSKFELFLSILQAIIYKKGKCSYSHSALADFIGVSRRTILRYFKILDDDPRYRVTKKHRKPSWVIFSCLSASLSVSDVTPSINIKNELSIKEHVSGLNARTCKKCKRTFKINEIFGRKCFCNMTSYEKWQFHTIRKRRNEEKMTRMIDAFRKMLNLPSIKRMDPMPLDNDSQPEYSSQEPKKGKAIPPSNGRANVNAYQLWEPPPEVYEDADTVMKNVAKGLNSPDFQAFVRLVGKDVANNYLRRMLDNKTK
jgi:hypothetical protein